MDEALTMVPQLMHENAAHLLPHTPVSARTWTLRNSPEPPSSGRPLGESRSAPAACSVAPQASATRWAWQWHDDACARDA
jgi:hypothetical protein